MGDKISFNVLTEDTFAQIYQALWKRLYCKGYSLLRDKSLTQELVQDVFVKLWLKRNELGKVDDAEAYLSTALRNKVYDYFDSAACREKHLRQALKYFSEERCEVDDAMLFTEGLTLVREELEKMPKKTRTVFQLSRFDKYSNEEIAEKTHLSRKAVEYHIAQAIKKLRVRLAVFLS